MYFLKGAIIVCSINCCSFLFSQKISFSRRFDALKKNVPVFIINKHPNYFHVLRYNKMIHDMTIERRAKPSADIVAFTPLKLDSVNASWFDYEELDYLFFEHNHKAYFLFEKILNAKKTLYLKVIDTLGKSSGFIELAAIEKDNASLYFSFGFKKVANDNILIIASRLAPNATRRQVLMLFDIEKRRMIWTKKLPVENAESDFTIDFETNSQNELIYLHSKNTIKGYETIYRENIKYSKPLLKLDSLFLIKWGDTTHTPIKKTLQSRTLSSIKKAFVYPNKSNVLVLLQGLQHDTLNEVAGEFFLNLNVSFSSDTVKQTTTGFDSQIQKSLTFYDGEHKEYYYKTHTRFANYASEAVLNTFSERVDGNYYKEILFRRTDLNTGEVVLQKLIPRKLFFFQNRNRFRNVGKVMWANVLNQPRILTIEAPSNFKLDPEKFVNKQFKKETNLWNSNVIMYSITSNGKLKKELIFRNSDFDLVPMNYEGDNQAADMIFYLNSGVYEKFLIWKPAP